MTSPSHGGGRRFKSGRVHHTTSINSHRTGRHHHILHPRYDRHHGRLSRFADHRRGQGVREADRHVPLWREEGLPQLLRRDEGSIRHRVRHHQPHRRIHHLRKVPGARGGHHGRGRHRGEDSLRVVVQGPCGRARRILREVPEPPEGQEALLRGHGHGVGRDGPSGRPVGGRFSHRRLGGHTLGCRVVQG